MRTIFQWLRWVCLLLLGLAWTTTSSFAAVGALNQANGGLTIRYDALETQNRGYDAEPLRAWDNNPPEMVDASAFFGSSAQFNAAKATPRAFWTGVDGELAAQASGAQVLKPSQTALDAATKGNWSLMRAESAAWAKGATGDVPVFFGNGKGRIFLNDELPELLKNMDAGTVKSINISF